MKNVKVFRLPDGKEPFEEWARGLPEETRAVIDAYIDRVALGGGKKNIRALKDGVFEIKIDKGPGWRIYFGEDGKSIILLLLGGDKRTQDRDIKKAKEYWRMYAQK